ncbi:MAG: hypothetical protein HOP28_02830 [Gemmatimonadales bacterium]|nr:hypothetical protein [Gemmatimonadales bacterium]
MTYLFKLAHRIAKIRTPLLIAAIALSGCGKGEKTDFLAPNPNGSTPVLQTIRVEPQLGSVRVGDEVQFTATGYSATGALLPVTVDWSATGGIITSDGRFTGVLTGPHTVTARARDRQSVADSARVTVWNSPTEILALVVSPDSAIIEEGDTLEFSAALAMVNGALTQSAAVSWSSSGGFMDSFGRFSAAVAGEYVITAQSVSSLRGIARIFVQKKRRRLQRINIDPTGIQLNPAQTRQFQAAGDWSDGSSAAPDVVWSATGGTVANGLFTAAGTPGSFQVVAREQDGNIADTASVTIVETAITKLAITPGSVSLTPNAPQQFSALAQRADNSWNTVALNWRIVGAGSISSAGLYTAPAAAGNYQVIVGTPGSAVEDTAEVRIETPVATLNQIIVAPSSATVAAGGSRQFSLTGVWSDGGSTAPDASWSATGGTISASGLFVAGSVSGTYTVIATATNGKADTSVVTISAPVLTAVQLTPANSSLQVGQTQQFAVSGSWSNGATTAPAVSYTANGGTISAGGLYTAGSSAGTYSVIAAEQGGTLADTSFVTISTPAPVLAGVLLSPASVTLNAGGVQQFTAVGSYSNGTTGTITISWSETGGSINSTGRFTAGSTPGTYRVVARLSGGTMADTSTVIIASPATLTGLSVSPKPYSAQVSSAARQFNVSATWSSGATTVPSILWTATGGSITSGGLYTPSSTAGTFRVIARHSGGTLADTTAVTLTAAPPPPATLSSVTISPKPVSMPVAGAQQFNASALWSDGGTTVPSITWSATGGTVNGSGAYTAGSTAGTFRVIAAGGGKADTANITISAVAPTVTSFVLSPGSATVPAGSTQQFSTATTWSNGASGGVTVSYSATGGSISTNGLFTAAQAAGTFAVIASCSCGRADTSVVAVSAVSGPTLTSLRVSPKPVSVYTGGVQAFSVTPTWSDGSSTLPSITWSATGGNITNGGVYTAAGSAGTFRVIASGGGKADTSEVTVLNQPQAGNPVTAGGNQPSGFLTAMATKFDFVPPINASLNGWNSRVTGGTIDANNAFTVQDTDAPYGPTVLRIQFPAISNGEHLGGNAPVWLFGGGNFGSGARLYVRVRMKIDARWSNMGNGGTKLMFVRNSSATDNHYTGFNLMETDSPTSMTASAGWQGTGEPGLSLFHRPSTGAVNLVDGQYHDLEWLLTPENPAGSTNGRIDLWVDGVKQNFSYGWENNIRMFNPGDTRRWEGIEIQPTFGGGIKDPPVLSTPLWWNIASVYVSTGN